MPTGKKKLFNFSKEVFFFSLCSNLTNPLMFLFTCKFDKTVKINQSHIMIRPLHCDEKQLWKTATKCHVCHPRSP